MGTAALCASVRLILISNKMLYLKSRVFHTLVPHVPCVTPSHKNPTRRWRYQNKTIVLFLMDSSMTVRSVSDVLM